jgi:hypothetical protein
MKNVSEATLSCRNLYENMWANSQDILDIATELQKSKDPITWHLGERLEHYGHINGAHANEVQDVKSFLMLMLLSIERMK